MMAADAVLDHDSQIMASQWTSKQIRAVCHLTGQTCPCLQDSVKAVGVMAPAVKQTLKSLVNPDMHFDGVHDFPSPTFYRKHAANFFREKLLAHVDLHLVGSNKVGAGLGAPVQHVLRSMSRDGKLRTAACIYIRPCCCHWVSIAALSPGSTFPHHSAQLHMHGLPPLLALYEDQ